MPDLILDFAKNVTYQSYLCKKLDGNTIASASILNYNMKVNKKRPFVLQLYSPGISVNQQDG